MDWLARQYGIDRARLRHLLRFLFAYIRTRQEDTQFQISMKEIEFELMQGPANRFECPRCEPDKKCDDGGEA